MRKHCQERLDTLPPESREQKAARKKGGEAKPSPREVGAARQAELWEAVDAAIDTMRASRTPERRQEALAEEPTQDAAPAPIAASGTAGEATGNDPYTSAEYVTFAEAGERFRLGLGVRRHVEAA